MERKTGKYEVVSTTGESVQAFIPHPLPPDPPVRWDNQLRDRFLAAAHALGELNTISTVLPDADLFIYTYIHKEAVLSSQIEGTQSSLADLLMHEQGQPTSAPLDDVTEVSNYLKALNHAMSRLDADDFPLSLRLIREMHEVLLRSGLGSRKTPGDFRTSQNWIGGSRPGDAAFVPPPPHELMNCLDALEKFLHDRPVASNALEKAAMTHVQFETIHPFQDGNGRVGRLLIALLLRLGGLLKEPVLYLSLYFKQNREEYYRRLQRVRTHGEWEEWLDFFAAGVEQTARRAVQTAKDLLEMGKTDRERIKQEFGQSAGSALRVQDALSRRILANAKILAGDTGLSYPTALKAIENFQRLGMAEEITGRGRNKVYRYREWWNIMKEGTEL